MTLPDLKTKLQRPEHGVGVKGEDGLQGQNGAQGQTQTDGKLSFPQRRKGGSVKKGQRFPQMVLGTLDVQTQKDELPPILCTIGKNELRRDHKPKCKT